MRSCFYHTDLVQNAVVHNFSRQIAFIQFRTIKARVDFSRNRSKKFPKSSALKKPTSD